jgi:hypothetical protein
MIKSILLVFVTVCTLTGCQSPQVVKTYNEDTTRTISQQPVVGQPVDNQKPAK